MTLLKWTVMGLLLGALMGVLVASGVLDVIAFFDPHTRPRSRRHLFDWNSSAEYFERFRSYPVYFAIAGAVLGGICAWRKMRDEKLAHRSQPRSGANDEAPKA